MLDKVLFYSEKVLESIGMKKEWQYKSLNMISFIGFLVGVIFSLTYPFKYSANDYLLLWILRGIGVVIVGFVFLIFYFLLGACLDEINDEDINFAELIGLIIFLIALFVVSIVLGSCVGIEGILITFLFQKLTKVKVRNIFLFLKGGTK